MVSKNPESVPEEPQSGGKENVAGAEPDPMQQPATVGQVVQWFNELEQRLGATAQERQRRVDQIRSEALTFALNANASGTAGVTNETVLKHAEDFAAFLSRARPVSDRSEVQLDPDGEQCGYVDEYEGACILVPGHKAEKHWFSMFGKPREP